MVKRWLKRLFWAMVILMGCAALKLKIEGLELQQCAAKQNGGFMPKSKKKLTSRKQAVTSKPKQADTQIKNSVNLVEELNALEWKKHSKVLKKKDLPMRIVRFIIGSIYNKVRDSIALSIESICESILQTLFQAEIIQRGPKWESFDSPRTMANEFLLKLLKCLELGPDDDDVGSTKKTDHWIVRGHRIYGQQRGGSLQSPYYTVYQFYRAFRFRNNWILSAPQGSESRKMWQEVWREAGKELNVKKELDKSKRDVAQFKADARSIATDYFHAEIRPLKEKLKTQHG